MPVHIPPETIKEIAQQLDMSMKCFYHIQTGGLEYYPDELRQCWF
jgi:phage pi2 protein 07